VPSVRFVCVGSGSEGGRAQLQTLCERIGVADRFIWSDARKDMPAVYSSFDIVCSASAHGEGFSNAVAEAMACERACVVTDVGDSAHIVDAVGEVVPPRDSAALARAMERLLAADRATIGPKARRRITEHFDVRDLAQRTLAALAQSRLPERTT
jgi:glycosyltransferase involved in cell wall biosynthesis